MEMRRMRILDLTIEDKIDDDFHTVKFNVSHIATEPNEFRNIDIWLPHTSSVQINDALVSCARQRSQNIEYAPCRTVVIPHY